MLKVLKLTNLRHFPQKHTNVACECNAVKTLMISLSIYENEPASNIREHHSLFFTLNRDEELRKLVRKTSCGTTNIM